MSPRFDTAMRWLLVASLALNVAVLGGVAWAHFSHDGPHQRHVRMARGTIMPNPMQLRRVLPPERRGVVDAALARHREHVRTSVADVFEARARVHALLTAETLDPAALESAFAELRASDAEAASAVQAMITEVAAELTPEERRKLGEAVHRHHPRMRHTP